MDDGRALLLIAFTATRRVSRLVQHLETPKLASRHFFWGGKETRGRMQAPQVQPSATAVSNAQRLADVLNVGELGRPSRIFRRNREHEAAAKNPALVAKMKRRRKGNARASERHMKLSRCQPWPNDDWPLFEFEKMGAPISGGAVDQSAAVDVDDVDVSEWVFVCTAKELPAEARRIRSPQLCRWPSLARLFRR